MKKRLFLATDLSIAVVERLVRLQEEVAEHLPEDVDVRWVDAPNIHVTLKFLGDTESSLVPMLTETLEKLVRPLFPFEIFCQRVGCFPKPSKPRIIWAGLDPKGAEVMGLLRQAIERDLEEIGFPPDEREYKPHVTLGRIKAKAPPNFEQVMEKFGAMRFGKSYIRDIILYESELGPDGPKYRVLNRFPLGEH